MPSVSSVDGNMNGGNKLSFITKGDVEKFIRENFPPHGLSQKQKYEEDDLDEIEIVEDGYLGLPPTIDEMMGEMTGTDPSVVERLLSEKVRLEKKNEGIDGETF